MEEELNVRLFDRSASQVALTEVGRLFYDHAAGICRHCNEAVEAVRRFQGLEQATLRVGASTIPAAFLIPDMLGRFSTAWPGVRLELQQGDTREVLRLLQDELVELAVVGGQLDDDSISMQEVMTERIILVAKPDLCPATMIERDQLVQLPLVIREAGSGTRTAVDAALQKSGLDPRQLRVVAQLGSSEAVRRAALSGAGAAFVSTLAVGHELADGNACRVEGQRPSSHVVFIWRPRGKSRSRLHWSLWQCKAKSVISRVVVKIPARIGYMSQC